jgi:hypothetical protein
LRFRILPRFGNHRVDLEDFDLRIGDGLRPPRDQELACARLQACDLGQQLDTGHSGHLVVGENSIEALLLEQTQRLSRGLGRNNLVSLSPQAAAQRGQDPLLIVDQEDTRHQPSPGPESGSQTLNVVLSPGSLVTSMRPRCRCTML